MTGVHLAGPADLEKLTRMVSAAREEDVAPMTDDQIAEAVTPLLDGSPHGVIYLIGMARAPLGYAVLSFGWSLADGGLSGRLEEIWIRPGVRRRGIGSEVLTALPKALAGAGLCALRLSLPQADESRKRFFVRQWFQPEPDHLLMTRRF